MEDENTMNITSAVFAPMGEEDEAPFSIQAVIEGVTMSVQIDPRNRYYKEILRQTEAKTLVVQAS
jgi:hypothetical protein